MSEQNNFETIKFLIETISSIKTSLDSVEKDTSRKADNIQNISEQLVMIVDALKRSNDSHGSASELITRKVEDLTKAVDELRSRMDVAEVKREHFGEKVDSLIEVTNDINMKTEVSSEVLYNIEKNVSDSKDMLIDSKVRSALNAGKKSVVKEPTFFYRMMEFIKNLDNVYKTILAIALFMTMVATIFFKTNLTELIVSIVKGIF